MKAPKAIGNQLRKFRFLRQANAPWWVIARFYALHTTHHLGDRRRRQGYRARKLAFRRARDTLALDNDWFTGNIPTWLRFLESEGLYAREKLDCLEIGSWQGLSAYFLLSELHSAHLTCVDTWQGADEHQTGRCTTVKVLSRLEQTFDANLASFRGRLDKYRGTSLSFFANRFQPSRFDLIYVDGSHYSDDVVVDAVKCFEMLKVGGVLVFDDYFWNYYERPVDNPAGAINAFLRLKQAQLRIIGFDYQLVIKKLADSARFRRADTHPARSRLPDAVRSAPAAPREVAADAERPPGRRWSPSAPAP